MKGTLIKIKTNLQGNNSRMDEAKNWINDLEHKKATSQKNKKPNKQPTQNKKKKESKKMRIV